MPRYKDSSDDYSKRRFECEHCGHRFTYKCDLQAHVGNIHGNSAKYQCEKCWKVFRIATNLRHHMRLHSDLSRPYVYKCSKCNVIFPRLIYLKKHYSKVHKDEYIHKCKHCSKRFISKLELEVHGKEHQGLVVHSCSFCDRSFPSVNKLRMHQSRFHTHENTHYCKKCNKSFYIFCKDESCRVNNSKKCNLYTCYWCSVEEHKSKHEDVLEDDGTVTSTGNQCFKCRNEFESVTELMLHQCDESAAVSDGK